MAAITGDIGITREGQRQPLRQVRAGRPMGSPLTFVVRSSQSFQFGEPKGPTTARSAEFRHPLIALRLTRFVSAVTARSPERIAVTRVSGTSRSFANRVQVLMFNITMIGAWLLTGPIALATR